MTILNIDTSTAVCSASISVNGKVVAWRLNNDGVNHAKMLPVFVDELLSELDQKGQKLDAVALSIGPGSYTGLRIGTSMAKGVCYGNNIPLLPIDTLQILCEAVRMQNPEYEQLTLCPMIDARRMEVYTALFQGFDRITEIEAKIITEDTFAEILNTKKICFFGDGAEKCKEVIKSENAVFIDNYCPDARFMGRLAEMAFQKGEKADVAYFTPFYLKEFQAAPSHVKGLK